MSELIKRTNEQLPAFMQGEEKHGDELMDRYIRPPRVKIIQPQAREPYDQFESGDVVLTPQLLRIAAFDKATKKGELWRFVPIFFYPEWCTWNPLGDETMIRARTLDPRNEIAIKAQSPDTWSEDHPEGRMDDQGRPLQIRHTEHLNFIVAPLTEDQLGMQIAVSFFRGELKVGATICSLIRMRNAPMYGQIFEAQVGQRKNQRGTWYGIDCRIPTSAPLFVEDEEFFGALKGQYEKYAAAHSDDNLQVDFEDEKAVNTAADETDF